MSEDVCFPSESQSFQHMCWRVHKNSAIADKRENNPEILTH